VSGKSLRNSLHAHGCTRCHLRYDDACADPATDGRCVACRGGKAWQLLIDSNAPRDCCRQQARLVHGKEEKERYRLAGSGLWFICPTCARTFPTNVRSKT
jgi:hypothetical protein